MRNMMTGACESLWVRLSRDCWGNLTAAWLGQDRIFSDSWTRVKSRLRHDWGVIWGVIEACLQLWLVPDCIRALERLRGIIENMIEGVAQSGSRRLLRILNPVWSKRSAYSQNFWRQILEQFSGQISSDSGTCFDSGLTWFWINQVRNIRAVLARFVQVFSCVMS